MARQCPGQPSLTIRSRAWLLDTGGVVSAVQSTQYIELHTVHTYDLCFVLRTCNHRAMEMTPTQA